MHTLVSAGDLTQRVTLQGKSVTRAANGEEVVTWSDVATVWAAVLPVRGREFFAAAQMQDATDIRVRLRYRAGVTRDMRVLHGSSTYDIVSVIDPESRHEELELMCLSGVRNG